MRVTAGGELIAESERAKLLFETGLAAGCTSPGADVAAGALSPSAKRTTCPYKGEATYWDAGEVADGAWSYESPLPESLAVARARRASTASASRSRWPSRPTALRSRA